MKREQISEALSRKTERLPNGCWLWLGRIATNGYGIFGNNKDRRIVHRVAYETVKGQIPLGFEIDHLCMNRRCINPDHLEPVTHSVNMARSVAARKFCKNGHERTPENVYLNPLECRVCKLARNRKYSKARLYES